MNNTPKSLRLHIGIIGRTNTGKSSFLNYISAQDVSITSPVPGTTTDVVEKTIELAPLGPVVLLDTAGSDDNTELGSLRAAKSTAVLDRCDIVCLLVESNVWTEYEDRLVAAIQDKKLPFIIVVNKTDLNRADEVFLHKIGEYTTDILLCSAVQPEGREACITALKEILIRLAPDDYFQPPPLAEDMVGPGGHAVLIVPIDVGAPKGRLILPQVQTLRSLLDAGAAGTLVKEDEYPGFLKQLKGDPELVICDSQVVDMMVRETPAHIKATTFSILFARFKGDLVSAARGAGMIHRLKEGDRVLIAEACSHHPMEDDIGRVKIPAWIEDYTGLSLNWTVAAGKDYPADLESYSLIIHCGACMLNRRAMLNRVQQVDSVETPMTNYGLAIATAHGVGGRVLEPFPEAHRAYTQAMAPTDHDKNRGSSHTFAGHQGA